MPTLAQKTPGPSARPVAVWLNWPATIIGASAGIPPGCDSGDQDRAISRISPFEARTIT